MQHPKVDLYEIHRQNKRLQETPFGLTETNKYAGQGGDISHCWFIYSKTAMKDDIKNAIATEPLGPQLLFARRKALLSEDWRLNKCSGLHHRSVLLAQSQRSIEAICQPAVWDPLLLGRRTRCSATWFGDFKTDPRTRLTELDAGGRQRGAVKTFTPQSGSVDVSPRRHVRPKQSSGLRMWEELMPSNFVPIWIKRQPSLTGVYGKRITWTTLVRFITPSLRHWRCILSACRELFPQQTVWTWE